MVEAGTKPTEAKNQSKLVNSDGDLCFTVKRNERSINFKIAIVPGTPRETVAQIEETYVASALAQMETSDVGNPFVNSLWTTQQVTVSPDKLVCIICGGPGGRGYMLWEGSKWPSGACVLCTGKRECRVYCFPTKGWPCPNPCHG